MTEETKQWYMEYKIHKNRPGLLGDIASMLGILGVNILTINGVEGERRGMLLETDDDEKIRILGDTLKKRATLQSRPYVLRDWLIYWQ